MKMLYPLRSVSCGGTLMRNINLFVEDEAHEDFLTALIQRFAMQYTAYPHFTLTPPRAYQQPDPQQHKTSHCLYQYRA